MWKLSSDETPIESVSDSSTSPTVAGLLSLLVAVAGVGLPTELAGLCGSALVSDSAPLVLRGLLLAVLWVVVTCRDSLFSLPGGGTTAAGGMSDIDFVGRVVELLADTPWAFLSGIHCTPVGQFHFD